LKAHSNETPLHQDIASEVELSWCKRNNKKPRCLCPDL
jgi:hypothetical protein